MDRFEPDADVIRQAVARRRGLLTRVSGTGVRKSALCEELDVSRSTVDRGVRELERLGLVERNEGRVQLTLSGRLALEAHDDLQERIRGIAAATTPLSTLPADVDFDTVVLEDASVVLPDPSDPYRPVTYLTELTEHSERIRSYAPAFVPPQVEVYRRSILENDLVAEVVVTDQVLSRLVADHAETLEATLRTDRLELLRTEEQVPYGIVLGESPSKNRMGVSVFSDTGMAGYIGNDTESAVEWARDRLAQCLSAATPVAEGQF